MSYFISLLNYVQRGTENNFRNTISTDQILINVIVLFCEDKNSVMKYCHLLYIIFYNCCSIIYLLLFSCSFVSDFSWPHGLQHARLPCPSLSPGACSNSCPLSCWCHPTILCCPLLLLPSISQHQSLNQWVSSSQQVPKYWASALASVLSMNIQDWVPLGLTSLISLLPKGLSRVFSSTTVQKHGT